MKQRIINHLLSYLLSSVNPDDIIKEKDGVLYIGKNKVGDIEMLNLVAEAKALEGFRIWKLMNETVKANAMEKGFNKSVSFDDLKTTKLMLYNLDILNSIVRTIRKRERK